MDFCRLGKLAIISAVALTLASNIQPAKAQTSTTVGTSFITAAALVSAAGSTLDFGSWAIDVQGAETITLPLLPALAPPPPVPIIGGATLSVIVNTVPPATSGTFTVTAPIATTLQIQANITTDFADPSLSLSLPTYTDTVAVAAAIPAIYGVPIVTIVAGGVAETVAVGGTLTISATPAAGATYSDAVISIDLRY